MSKESGTTQSWLEGGPVSRVYDRTVKKPRLFGLLARVMWSADTARLLYADMTLPPSLPGQAVLDVACGGGLALRGLSTDFDFRYVALDISEPMLELARREGTARGLSGIEYVQAPASAIPFDDATFDLCTCYHGLHCFTDPPSCVAEIARVLKPGGEFRGTVVVTGHHRLSEWHISMMQRRGQFVHVGSVEELRALFVRSGFADPEIERTGAYAHFRARRAVA
ncbi:class I SAM-dependent methyltransferase [Blastococcus montanus]|uniref:class I SAM-dependent methyltransferase n=1 Tax=Blastococcus montanus TaxID=3144973 RepID=UPI00320AEB16